MRRDLPIFQIVTPCLNAQTYISETIQSVVFQAGDFSLRYHIQDGGSGDGTLEICERWQKLIQSNLFPKACLGIKLTVSSKKDSGLYDAIARGFEHLDYVERDFMTWINADDLLAPGSLNSIAEAFCDLPGTELIGGRVAQIDKKGNISTIGLPQGISQECLAAGLHDGRMLPCIQQEGTFWRAGLWNRVGPVDTHFRLAGDWDLWRRFASEAPYVVLDTITAFHRKLPGQLSENMADYFEEIDQRLLDSEQPSDAFIQSAFASFSEGRRGLPETGQVARRPGGRWHIEPAPSRRPLFEARVGTGWEHAISPIDGEWRLVSGFGPAEGPFPEQGIDHVVYWMRECEASLEIFTNKPREQRLTLTISPSNSDQKVTLVLDDERSAPTKLEFPLPALKSIPIDRRFSAGWTKLTIAVDRPGEIDSRRLGLMLRNVELSRPEPTEKADGRRLAGRIARRIRRFFDWI